MTISILLADDHTILRQGLHVILTDQPGFEVIGEASDGLDVLKKVEELRPDVVVLDLGMPKLGGLEVIRAIHKRFTETRVVVLSMHAKEAYVLEALKNGASAYVLKGSEADELIHAIRNAMDGLRYLSPPLTERAIEAYMEKTLEQEMDPYETLTGRERQILHMAAEGFSNSQIADQLVISPRTVETHRSKMMRKLNLKSHTDLIRYAIKRGIILIDD